MKVINLGKVVGNDGKSSYQIWLEQGNTGTEQDFLNSLKGGNEIDINEYNLPILALTGDISGMDKDNAVTLNYIYKELSGTCDVKWQGSSSLAYPKKNYTIEFDKAFEAVEGWGTQKKYCLKANFIDFTQCRNVVSAKLWGQKNAKRSPANATLAACPNYGKVINFG